MAQIFASRPSASALLVLILLCGSAARGANAATDAAPAAASAASASAVATAEGFVFGKTVLDVAAAPDAERVEVEFPFVNRAARAVAVLDTKATCGCTAPALEKTSYAPGEAGAVKVVFTVGQRQGPQRLEVKVRTDAGEHDLVLKVEIPVRATLAPRLVLFRPDAAGPQTARIVYGVDTPVEIVALRGLHPSFKAEARAVLAGADYEIVVVYSGSTTEIVGSSIDIVSRSASGKERSDRLFVRHQP